MKYLGHRANREKVAELARVGAITRAQACEGKAAYPSQNDARHAAKHVAAKAGRLTDTYRCPFCGLYHVTKLKHGEAA